MWDGWNKNSAEDMEQRKKYQDMIGSVMSIDDFMRLLEGTSHIMSRIKEDGFKAFVYSLIATYCEANDMDPIVLSAEITVDVFEANGGPEKVRLCDGKGAGYRC